jgi:hypothetical protein
MSLVFGGTSKESTYSSGIYRAKAQERNQEWMMESSRPQENIYATRGARRRC